MRSRVVRVVAAFGVALLATWVGAQDVEQVASPYQGEYPYTIGTDLTPPVSVEGVHIDAIRVAPRQEGEIAADRDIEVEVTSTFTNNGAKTVRVLVVLLLEDGQGNALERLEMPSVRVPSEKTRSGNERFTVRGRIVLDTQKVYLFCELQ
jgi:hypothetical protein